MELAIQQAKNAATRDEVPVGAIIQDASGKIIAKESNKTIALCDPTAHAEINAIRKACKYSKGLYLNEVDHEISSPDIVDQASSQTEKKVEMRTLNRQIKLLSKIDKAIKRIKDNTYGY